MQDDPAAAQSEFLGLFRADLQGFLDDTTVDGAIVPARRELAPAGGVRYAAFTDPSGGRADSFTLAIAHQVPKRGEQPERLVLDAVRTVKPPFDPDQAVGTMAATLKDYGLSEVTGDQYGAEFVVSAFRKHGISYSRASVRGLKFTSNSCRTSPAAPSSCSIPRSCARSSCCSSGAREPAVGTAWIILAADTMTSPIAFAGRCSWSLASAVAASLTPTRLPSAASSE